MLYSWGGGRESICREIVTLSLGDKPGTRPFIVRLALPLRAPPDEIPPIQAIWSHFVACT